MLDAEALESYLIPEPATEGVGAAIGALCIGIIGIAGLVGSHKSKVKNKKTRQEVEAYLQSKGVDCSDTSISRYQDKVIKEMTTIALQSAKKVVSNSKFQSQVEATMKSKLAPIAERERAQDDEDERQYGDDFRDYMGGRRTWFNYSKGMLKLDPKLEDFRKITYGISLLDENCRFFKELYNQEAQDDNAPEYFDQVTEDIFSGIGEAISKELEVKYADDIAAGLVSVEYVNMFNSEFISPAIVIHKSNIPGRDGKYPKR